MTRRHHLSTLAGLALGLLAAGPALAQDTVKVGVILPMTGQSASTGKQIEGAIKLWLQQTGGKAGAKKIEVLIKDDAGVAEDRKSVV